MKTVMTEKITAAEEIMLTDIPVPKVRPGLALIKVKAFGLNHSEQILRQEEIEAPYIQKPVIPVLPAGSIILKNNDIGVVLNVFRNVCYKIYRDIL